MSLGAALPAALDQQVTLAVQYRNTGKTPCTLNGRPRAVLVGPADPNGTRYELVGALGPSPEVGLQPGKFAVAELTVLRFESGDVGSLGSTRWLPTRLLTVPPGEEAPLAAQWPRDLPVLRQDSASRPGSYIGGFTSPVG